MTKLVALRRDPARMLHFAYASNMDAAMMRRRCPTARLEGRASLRGYRFMIVREGFASIAPAAGACVHGVLWRLAPRDLAALNAYEQIAGGLYRALILPIAAGCRHRAALVYVARDRLPGRPRPGYLELVIAAARAADLPVEYVRRLVRFRG